MDYIKYIRSMVGHEKIILVAGGCIIEDNGKILLQHRSDNGHWGLPGGCLEMGESPRECAIREVKEETGLDVELASLVGVYDNFEMEWPNKDKAHIVSFVFTAKAISGELRIDEESLELKYFSESEMPYIAGVDTRNAIKDYFAGKRNIIE